MRTRVVLCPPISGIAAYGPLAQPGAPPRKVFDTPSDALLIDPVW
jgi:hypothetical protein